LLTIAVQPRISQGKSIRSMRAHNGYLQEQIAPAPSGVKLWQSSPG